MPAAASCRRTRTRPGSARSNAPSAPIALSSGWAEYAPIAAASSSGGRRGRRNGWRNIRRAPCARGRLEPLPGHCEERSDAAIQAALDCFASLAMTKTPRILIIAGSDSGGGAGVQADIKTVTMLGGFATSAITAITAQNSLGVEAVMAVPVEMVLKQIEAVLADIGADAVKIG